MKEQLQESLLIRRPTKGRKSMRSQYMLEQEPRTTQRYIPILEEPIRATVSSVDLEWESSSEQVSLVNLRQIKRESLKLKYWDDSANETKEKTLNDSVFNLEKSVQKKLYYFNKFMNVIMRCLFINLLVFLAIESKWIYLYLFLSLQFFAILLYIIVMVKMLFTRSDKESIYFQKIFKESDWADIEAERVMRSHFELGKILSKIKTFFNPCTRFEKDTKILFLRQEIFKRMELVLVILPFTVMFGINKNDFVTDAYPNFSLWITVGISLEIFRTLITYIIIYIWK